MRTAAPSLAQPAALGRSQRGWFSAESGWFLALVAAICFEGTGRKLMPWMPAVVFYFFKDVILLAGLFVFKIGKDVVVAARSVFPLPFLVFFPLGILWTLLEVNNPETQSVLLGLVGVRAYWLWWLAPLVIATALRSEAALQRSTMVLVVVAVVVAGYAAVQFVSPSNSSINQYALAGDHVMEVATVASTGRARVASTFSFLSGFANFVILVPCLLLALGLSQKSRRMRMLCLVATGCCLVALPMSGSRGAVISGAMALGCVFFGAGAHRTRAGLRALLLLPFLVVAGSALFPEAIAGVVERFGYSDTNERMESALNILPPVALTQLDYPPLGIGTGTEQNAAYSLGYNPTYYAELEQHRILVELGVPGYLLCWFLRIGLVIALGRLALLLRRMGAKAVSGVAAAYAILALQGNLVFDHVFQALFFLGCGLILQAYLVVLSERRAARSQTLQPLPAVR